MTKQEAAAVALAAMVDELGGLEIEVAPYKAKIKRADALRSAIRGEYSGTNPYESFAVTGEQFTALLGPCGMQSVVDNGKLFKLAGPKLFLEMASVSLKMITAFCPTALGAVVTIEHAGLRSLSVVKQ
jgi:hypothetical protein